MVSSDLLELRIGSGFYGVPLIYDLHTDPNEENTLNSRSYYSGWIRWPAGDLLVKYIASLQMEQPIRPGTADP